ncbi:hypothetical protein MRB53_020298 [Persea americana]|uniref:Uncharacterized protein n=1 Tax=Persea americana TaxID=3435 RepID=A0ACC2L1G5_PERAE|nr:hypothetical protein MRB53_020298 [Persea americana]
MTAVQHQYLLQEGALAQKLRMPRGIPLLTQARFSVGKLLSRDRLKTSRWQLQVPHEIIIGSGWIPSGRTNHFENKSCGLFGQQSEKSRHMRSLNLIIQLQTNMPSSVLSSGDITMLQIGRVSLIILIA